MEEAYEYSWPEQFYYFALFRTLNGPDATPGKDCDDPIDSDTYFTQADLCMWIREQNHSRKAFLDGKASDLTANQIKVLDGIGFPWMRDSSERWDGHFQELIEYKAKHGHCNVPPRSCKLGVWVKNQRAAYHKLRDIAAGREMDPNVKRTTAVITPDQIKLLNDIGFQWKLREDHGITWDRHFEDLKAFKEQHGHTRVSPKEIPSLARWVGDLRYQYKHKAEKWRITEDQFARLNEIGFEWQKRSVDPDEINRRKQEKSRKHNERRRRRRQEAKLQRQKEAEAALKHYQPQAKKRRTDDASLTENATAKPPKKTAGTQRKSSGEKVKERSEKPRAEEPKLAKVWELIPLAIAARAPPTKNDIVQRLAELRKDEQKRGRKIRKITEDRRKSGRLVVSRIVKLAAGATTDDGTLDGAAHEAGGGADEETGEVPPGSGTSAIVKLAASAPADEGSVDEARNGTEEEDNLAGENNPMDKEAGKSMPGSGASNTAKLSAGVPHDEENDKSGEDSRGEVNLMAEEVISRATVPEKPMDSEGEWY